MSAHNYKIFLFDSARNYVIQLIWKPEYWEIFTPNILLQVYDNHIQVIYEVNEYICSIFNYPGSQGTIFISLLTNYNYAIEYNERTFMGT